MSSIDKELPGHVNPKSNRKGSGQLGLCSGRILSGLMGSRIKTKGSGLVKPNAGSEKTHLHEAPQKRCGTEVGKVQDQQKEVQSCHSICQRAQAKLNKRLKQQ